MSDSLSPPANRGSLFKVFEVVGPMVLAVVAGYGAVRFTEGATQQRIKTIEDQQQQAVTRDEFKQFTESTREDLREIKADVRAIRSDLQRR